MTDENTQEQEYISAEELSQQADAGSLATINKTREALRTLGDEYPANLAKKATDEELKEACKKFTGYRTGLDKAKKALKEPYQKVLDRIEAVYKATYSAVADIEEPWAKEKKKRAEAEKKRQEELERKIEGVFTRIRAYLDRAHAADSAVEIGNLIEECRAEDCTDAYARGKEALELRNEILGKLGDIHYHQVEREANAKRLAQLEAEKKAQRKLDAAKEQIGLLKSIMLDLMDAPKSQLEVELKILEGLHLEEDEFGELYEDAVEAREKALAGLKKLIAIAPDEEPEPEQYGNPGEHIRAEEAAARRNVNTEWPDPAVVYKAATSKKELDVVVQLRMPESRMSAVMSLLMDQFTVEPDGSKYRFSVK